MLKILHRVNDPGLLAGVDPALGVEMDVHAYGDRIVVHHDAFRDGPTFDRWLDSYRQAFAILNVKEEGIEGEVRRAVLARGIEDFFLLDLSFPALIKLARAGERRVAVRVSKYEPVAGALALAGMVDWVWIDVFDGFPLNGAECRSLRAAGLRLCLVSPELQGYPVDHLHRMRSQLRESNIELDAVCTKQPHLW
jgi:hypothetical protein